MADNSFILLNRISLDKSRLFENLVFNYLKREYGEVFYYKTKNNKEIDFYISDYDNKSLFQASYTLENNETKQREISSLLKAMNELNMEKGYIYTYNEKEEIEIGGKKITIVPFWLVALGD